MPLTSPSECQADDEIDTVVNEPNSKRENEVQFRVQKRFWGFVLLLQRREAMTWATAVA